MSAYTALTYEHFDTIVLKSASSSSITCTMKPAPLFYCDMAIQTTRQPWCSNGYSLNNMTEYSPNSKFVRIFSFRDKQNAKIDISTQTNYRENNSTSIWQFNISPQVVALPHTLPNHSYFVEVFPCFLFQKLFSYATAIKFLK